MELIHAQPEQAETTVSLPHENTPLSNTSAEKEALLETLSREAAKFRRMRRAQKWILAAYIGIPVLLYAIHGLLLLLGISTHKWSGNYFQAFTSWYIIGAFAASKGLKKATIEAAELDDIRAVGPLADALAIESRHIRAVAETKLIELLPRLKASDAELLNKEQRGQLNGVLRRSVARFRWRGYSNPSRREDLAVAILKAYEQVGDAKALPGVEWLASGQGLAARVPEIQEAAKACLLYLRERVEKEQARQTLLRPSSQTLDSESLLLRPAQGTESDPQQLLRPASP